MHIFKHRESRKNSIVGIPTPTPELLPLHSFSVLCHMTSPLPRRQSSFVWKHFRENSGYQYASVQGKL